MPIADPFASRIRIVKVIIFAAALVPFARLIWLGVYDGLGANPIEYFTRATGDWTLYFLCMTLAVTPLRRLSGWTSLARLRRMLGLFTFFYACVHFMAFFWFDHFFDVQAMFKDVLKRPFIAVGFMAFSLLIPLAATSTNGMIKRIGARRWQLLHRAVYAVALLAILHFWWMKAGKNDFAEPALFGTIVAMLLLLRVRRFNSNQAR